MPIRFRCPECQRRLSVGSRKAGHEVRCPKCSAAVTVPTLREAAAIEAMGEGPDVSADEASEAPADGLPDFAFDLDALAPSEATRPGSSSAVREFDPDLVSVSRRVLYAQGVLLATLALVAFIAGYLVGSASSGPAGQAEPAVVPEGQPFLMRGLFTWRGPGGAENGDDGGVMILLPERKFPGEKIPIDGLRPGEPLPAADATSLQAIETLGGVYDRADEDGAFELVVPRPGRYHVLLLSRRARRPEGEQPRPEDIALLGSFFHLAADLLGKKKYDLRITELESGSEIMHDFGRSGG